MENKSTMNIKELKTFSKIILGKNIMSDMFFHPYPEVICVMGGCGKLCFPERIQAVSGGEIFIINPSKYYIEKTSLSSNLVIVSIKLINFTFPKLIGEKIYKIQSESAFELFKILDQEISEKKDKFKAVSEYLFKSIMIELDRNIKIIKIDCSRSSSEKQCLALKIYIDANFDKSIDLKTMAQTTTMSVFHASHSFKKFMGVSPMKYLLLKRIDNAKKLLSETQLTISEISKKCGFNNMNNFCQSFKENTGMCANSFRKQNRIVK